MIGSFIEKYKTYRKQKYLKQFTAYKHKYAFLGVGNHSINNLYPVLDYLGLPLKYICTKNSTNAIMMAEKYGESCTGTSDLDLILNDDEVKGVFVCTSPEGHFGLSKKVLKAGKALFVEKPPCLSLSDLQELISVSGKTIIAVGLQKRYSTVYSLIKMKAKNVISYNYRFCTGAYPEGDAIWDLYIHPLDTCIYLFGEVDSVNCIAKSNTLLVQVSHVSGVVGMLELSTDYSWSSPVESLTVNAKNGIFTSDNLHSLNQESKSKQILGIPLEKVLKTPPVTHKLYNNTGAVPVIEYNELYAQGYYGEVKCFLDAVEGKGNRIKTTLTSLESTFQFIDKIVPFTALKK